ncbi:hypothetical protein [Mucilaginibacter sp. L3T2-6]|uniref:hypothetical protein n=1 Tax=Mucilaginibacter sp. L3T2-6 TaxID=3062491 RepID=UPI00267718EC|nr:hypothetical protein [Mucilaginibacter sp. L3T2-6]MDO3641524.1 hypothetical protein [Mucilaginibacter sp. L3T2-6]MDV6213715.1 hypothetical protein [Mucilaginibacter sp. L3T2-6]
MLHQITWQQFLLFTAIVLLLYYAILWLIFYRGKTSGLFPGRPSAKLWPEPGVDLEDEDLLGGAAEEYGVSTVNSSDLFFGPSRYFEEDRYEETHPFPDDETLYGLIPDVLEEIKSVIHTIRMEDGTAEDFKSLFKLVSSKYPQLKVSRHLDAVNSWILENVPFELSEEELYRLWD